MIPIKDIATLIIDHYHQHGRDLPWRKTKDPYKIWLSEIILQQTTVAYGLDYYQKFITTYPDIYSLAQAPLDEVLKHWEGLGYYSRARNLHHTAKELVAHNNGQLPDNYDDLLHLKGIGPYTAAAISSFAFNGKTVVVDGNVLRLISRLAGITNPIDIKETQKTIRSIAQQMLQTQEASIFNQAIMEMGATICKPKKPNCDQCPISIHCLALDKNLIPDIPYKSKKIKKTKRFFNYYVLIDSENTVLIQQRTNKDIWQGLWQFPLVESFDKLLDIHGEYSQFSKLPYSMINRSKVFRQALTHQNIHSQFFEIRLDGRHNSTNTAYKLIKWGELDTIAFPKTLTLYLDDNGITLL